MAVKKHGRIWVADFCGRNGQRVKKKAPTQELAKAFERGAKAREFCGDLLDVVRDRISLVVLIEHYESLHENGNTQSTRKRNRIVFRNLKENLGNPTIQEITERDLERYKAAL